MENYCSINTCLRLPTSVFAANTSDLSEMLTGILPAPFRVIDKSWPLFCRTCPSVTSAALRTSRTSLPRAESPSAAVLVCRKSTPSLCSFWFLKSFVSCKRFCFARRFWNHTWTRSSGRPVLAEIVCRKLASGYCCLVKPSSNTTSCSGVNTVLLRRFFVSFCR